MPKVMHINCSCVGSTGKIIGDIADHTTTMGYEHVLCAPGIAGENRNIRYYRTSLPYEQGIYRRLNYLYGFQYGLAPLSTCKIKRIIDNEKPDLIHIHCANGFMVNVYAILRYISKKQIPVVVTNHAEFFYTGSCPYAYDCEKWLAGCRKCPQKVVATGGKLWDTSALAWQRMKNAFAVQQKITMVSVSPWVEERAKCSPITETLRHETVLNGINTSVFAWRDQGRLKEKYGFAPETKIVFHPTANFSVSAEDRKGGRFVVELARCVADKNVVFLVAGKHAQGLKIPDNMILLGMIADQQKLAEYYAMADVTVVAGKRETFNMPVAESLCCGTPVVGFCAGGPESIALEEYSQFVEYGDLAGLKRSVERMLAREHVKMEIAEKAKQKYAAAVMANGYMEVYQKLLTDRSI